MAYPGHELFFGPEYLIPKPFDPRLIVKIAPAVAQAAIDSGVATRPITDWAAYRAKLSEFVYHSGVGMRAIFQAARQAQGKRIIFAEGEPLFSSILNLSRLSICAHYTTLVIKKLEKYVAS